MRSINNLVLLVLDLSARAVAFIDSRISTAKRSVLRRNRILTNTERDLERITRDIQEFLYDPQNIATDLSACYDKYRELVEIYFILKQTTSLYEAESKTLPIQVFNEFRNAFDHVVRSMLNKPDDHGYENGQLKKSEGHIQRAFLDTAKLLCAHYDESCRERHKSFSSEVKSIVDNGEYIRQFTALQYASHDSFVRAKLEDYQLGSDGESSVREKYIRAVLDHKRVYEFQRSKLPDLRWGKARLTAIKGLKWTSAILASLIAGILLEFRLELFSAVFK